MRINQIKSMPEAERNELLRQFFVNSKQTLAFGVFYDPLRKVSYSLLAGNQKNRAKFAKYIDLISEDRKSDLNNIKDGYMTSYNAQPEASRKKWVSEQMKQMSTARTKVDKRKQEPGVEPGEADWRVGERRRKRENEKPPPKKMYKRTITNVKAVTKGKESLKQKREGGVEKMTAQMDKRVNKSISKRKSKREQKVDERRNPPDTDMIENAETEKPGQVSMVQAGKMTSETKRKGPHMAGSKLKLKKPALTAATTVPKKVPYAREAAPSETAMTELQRAHDKQAQNIQKNKVMTANTVAQPPHISSPDTVAQAPHSDVNHMVQSEDYRPAPDPKTSPDGQEPDTVYQPPNPGVNTVVQSKDYRPAPDPKTSPFGQESDTVEQRPRPAAKRVKDPSLYGKLVPSPLYVRPAQQQQIIPSSDPGVNVKLLIGDKKNADIVPYTMPLHPHYPDRRGPPDLGSGGGESKGADYMDVDEDEPMPPANTSPEGPATQRRDGPPEPPPPPPPQAAPNNMPQNTVGEDGNYIEIDRGVPGSSGGLSGGASHNVNNERKRMLKSSSKLLHEIKAFIELYG